MKLFFNLIPLIHKYIIVFFCLCIVTGCIQSVYADTNADVHIEATPDWVKLRDTSKNVNIPVNEIKNGVFYRLIDNQFKLSDGGERIAYSRYVETVINQAGIDRSSQISLDYDPTYQKLALNTLFVVRDGKRLNKLNSAKISIFSSEKELENRIYNGSLTMNIIIDDIREGDTIDYSFTYYGANPILKGIFSYSRFLNWTVPVHDQHVRVLWGKSTPLYIKTRNIEPEIQKTKKDTFTEYQIHMHNVKTVASENELPYWYDPFGVVYISESETWGDVVDWALTLYQNTDIHPSIAKLAQEIKDESSNKSEQIVKALNYTQNQIRYVGLEMGVNSHLPTPAHETVALRYGDCKDKAVLFIAILRALGITAHPALVDTDETKLLIEKLPAVNSFNHVIVLLEFNGKKIWLDPTLSYQFGPLESLYEPDYGFALVVKNGQNSLTSMASETHNSSTKIIEKYSIPNNVKEPVTLSVVSQYFGNLAHQKYSQIERDGKKKLSKDYELYYQKIYPEAIAFPDLKINTNHDTGVLEITEKYKINKFWSPGNSDYEVEFYPSDIRGAVYKPKQIKRSSPLWFRFPNNITVQVEVSFDQDGWNFKEQNHRQDNEFFYYKSHVKFSDNKLVLNYEYRSKTDHIPANKITEYLKERDQLLDDAYYGIIKYAKEKESDPLPEQNDSWNWILFLSLFYLVALIFSIISWRIESKQRPEFPDVHFYPVSVSKFMVLSSLTFSVYSCYWMYRNWQSIKVTKNVDLMPIWRSIFIVFWFYPLFNALKRDSLDRFKENKVLIEFLAVIFAISYFIISIGLNSITGLTAVALTVFMPIFFIPLVNYINAINKTDTGAYHYNSAWYARNIVLVLLFFPIFVIQIASETPLLPNSTVVEGEDLMKRDLKFLQRNKIIPVDEHINYFYSDAFLSIRDDGNGFTENTVFSYWLDEKDELNKETVTFDKIKNIEVKFAEKETENTIVTVTRMDESNFMLFVSPEKKADKIFVEKLKQLWKQHS